MFEEDARKNLSNATKLMSSFLNFPFWEYGQKVWELTKNLFWSLYNEGLYETLDYESTLEIHDPKGLKATFSKIKKVRFLQSNIISYQDYAWGDGEILHNYRSNKGKAVDRYRSGYKTYILLSLREVKNRGDIDEFNIQWNIRRGFLTRDGYWGTDVSQPTKHLKINIVFPKSRPPLHLTLEENQRQRTRTLGSEAQKQLLDGRWMVTWETNKPKLHELYVVRWIW
jgi:hypothetical protein